MFCAVLGLMSCSDSSSEEGVQSLAAPKIIQNEEILDNPITLAFSWEAVDNAAEYAYELSQVKEAGNEVVATGKTKELSVEIASSDVAELLYSTEYMFVLKAVSADGSLVSEAAEASVKTGDGPIALSVEDLTYRSAVLKGVPADKEMLYQFAQVPVEKFAPYDSDMAFIEGYDYGYYKAMAAAMPWIPWYGFMQEGSQKGDHVYNTKILKPGKDYVLYAYGVEFNMDDSSNPVKVTTPMVKHFFTTPEWKATSECTFTLSVEGQELLATEYGDDIVNIKVKVIPSDPKERYYVAFAKKDQLAGTYDNDIYDFAFDMIYSEETYGVDDWSTSDMLSSGEQVISSKDFGWGLYPASDYKIMVFGVNGDGLVTTSIVSVDCTTMGDDAAAATRSDVSLKHFGTKKQVSVTDRQ